MIRYNQNGSSLSGVCVNPPQSANVPAEQCKHCAVFTDLVFMSTLITEIKMFFLLTVLCHCSLNNKDLATRCKIPLQ